jgi:hypothetical protein
MTGQTTTDAAPTPFLEEHRNIIKELLADANELSSKIEAAKAVTQASVHLESAKSAIILAARHIFQHFDVLAADAKAEIAEAKIEAPPTLAVAAITAG